MKTRQDYIEFDRNYCTHYAPQPGSLKQDYCAIGCDASARMKEAHEAGEPNSSPCIGGHKSPTVLTRCPKWERRSIERAETRADSIESAIRDMMIVDRVVYAWRSKPKPNRNRSEVIECPVCKGRLHLWQSCYNGHVHGNCKTEGCVSWME